MGTRPKEIALTIPKNRDGNRVEENCLEDSKKQGRERKEMAFTMSDYIVRATAAGGQVRAFASTTRGVVERARAGHNASPVAAAALGRLLTAAGMMGSMMKGEDDLLTIRIQGNGPIGSLTVTANAKGDVKGFAGNPQVMLPPNAQGKLDVGGAVGAGMLSVIMDIGLKEPYVGQTALVSGEIAEDLTYYYAASEQTPSSVALGVLMNRDNTVRQAGGFIIQMMPGASDAIAAGIEEKLRGVSSVTALLDAGMTPEDMLAMLLGDIGLEITDRLSTRFYCGCSKARVEKALISIGRKDLQEMIDDGKPIEAGCHFCGKKYTFTVPELEELLRKAGPGQTAAAAPAEG